MIPEREKAQLVVDSLIQDLNGEGEVIHGIRTILIEIAKEIANMTVTELEIKIAKSKGYEVEGRDPGTIKIKDYLL